MIELKDFQNLLQIQSLEIMATKHLNLIREHKSRIEQIENTINNRRNDLTDYQRRLQILNSNIQASEDQLNEIDIKLGRTKKNATEVTSIQQTKAIEKELLHLEQSKDLIEEETLDEISQSEELEKQIKDAESFCEGSKESLLSIKTEANDDIKKEENEINNINGRIANLLSISSEEAQQSYKHVATQFENKFPIAHVIHSQCNRCFNELPRHMEAQINKGNTIDHCPGCGRLLAPNI